jgi:hypothetical protein
MREKTNARLLHDIECERARHNATVKHQEPYRRRPKHLPPVAQPAVIEDVDHETGPEQAGGNDEKQGEEHGRFRRRLRDMLSFTNQPHDTRCGICGGAVLTEANAAGGNWDCITDQSDDDSIY